MRTSVRSALVLGGTMCLSFTSARLWATMLDGRPEPWEAALADRWAEIASGGTATGREIDGVLIVTFSDFQCPVCADAAPTLAAAERDMRTNVRYRHFPLTSIHPHALQAAHASECAAEQDRFSAYAETLFRRQTEIGAVEWAEFAIAAGIPDIERFAACHEAGRHLERVATDLRLARQLGLPGTPVVAVAGEVVRGPITREALEAAVERARGRRRSRP